MKLEEAIKLTEIIEAQNNLIRDLTLKNEEQAAFIEELLND